MKVQRRAGLSSEFKEAAVFTLERLLSPSPLALQGLLRLLRRHLLVLPAQKAGGW